MGGKKKKIVEAIIKYAEKIRHNMQRTAQFFLNDM